MKSKILVLGFACLSLVAVAQSNEKQSKEKQNQPAAAVKSPRDIATGQASGRAMSDQKVVHRDLAARDAQSGKATGKKMAQDDWHQQRVAVGDVNGDGKADVTANGSAHASGQNAVINNSHSNIKNQRDMATGQASGKRQHQPLTVSKEVDKASPKTSLFLRMEFCFLADVACVKHNSRNQPALRDLRLNCGRETWHNGKNLAVEGMARLRARR